MQLNELPDTLKPYQQHGIDLNYKPGAKEATGECPWCGREEKFSVNVETGQWRCFVCSTSGNSRIFVRELWKLCFEETTEQDYETLAHQRKLLYAETLIDWHTAKSVISGNWLIPGYGADGKLNTLYQYVQHKERKVLMPTTGLGHQIHGMNLYEKTCKTLYLCEGFWDGLALWETLGRCKRAGNTLKATGNPETSLLQDACVLATPGCEVFFESWLDLFAGKSVYLMAQNDHERIHPKTKATVAPASYNGIKKVVSLLSEASVPPAELFYTYWGENGFDPELPHGYDVRDELCG